jgi:hypothetical protein
LFLSITKRNPKITDWARTVALVWGIFALVFAFVPTSTDPSAKYSALAYVAEGLLLLTFYFVLRLPSSMEYLGDSPPNNAIVRSREE